MRYKFNDDSIVIGYIKELLHNFNLPRCKVYKEGMKLYEGNIYLKDLSICICNKEGKLEKVSGYIYGEKIQNLTSNLTISSSIYDQYTHEYLGQYLRFIRDYKGIDLMPLYNCFSSQIAKGLNFNVEKTIPTGRVKFKINTDDERYYHYLVPVKFNQTYTLGIDASVPYDVCLLIYTGDKVSDESKKLVLHSFKTISGSTIRNPHILNTNIDSMFESSEYNIPYYISHELDLRLLIRLPKVVKSSITILEGDYSLNTQTFGNVLAPKYVYNEGGYTAKFKDEEGVEHEQDIPSFKSKYVLRDITNVCKLSLLDVNSKVSYPFANRLVEYLLGNVVTNYDDISSDIERVQDDAYRDTQFEGVYGIFDGNLKRSIYTASNVNTPERKGKRKFAQLYRMYNGKYIPVNEQSVGKDDPQHDFYESNRLFYKLSDITDDILYFADKDIESFIKRG